MKLLEDKVAIVTGSGRGIGNAIAHLFADHGASLVVNDLDEKILGEAVAKLKAQGAKAVGCLGSVTAPNFPEELMRTTMESFGRIDIIVNNAGYTWDSVIQKLTDEMWQAIIDVHLTAPFKIIRAAVPYMREVAKKEQAEGRSVYRKIINVSSTAGLGGNPGQANYSSAKMGVVGLTKTMAKEWAQFNINVNAVAYGFIDTRLTRAKEEGEKMEVAGRQVDLGIPATLREMAKMMIPMGRPGTTEEAAGPVLFLASELSNYVTGHVLLVTGGLYM